MKVCAKQRTVEDHYYLLNVKKLLWSFDLYIIDGEKNHAVCVMEYFYDSAKQASEDDSSEDPVYEGYKAVLDSKAKDETLVTQGPFLSCSVKHVRN